MDRLEKHLADLQQRYDANQQDKTNRRLAGLTVISAIFLALRLVRMTREYRPKLRTRRPIDQQAADAFSGAEKPSGAKAGN